MNSLNTISPPIGAVPLAVSAGAKPAPPAAPQADAAAAQADLLFENQLVEVRLGLASSLFLALRAKHGPTAAHSLRVALGCSAWSIALEIDEHQRDELEVAALLHDIGKLGVPDAILLKPGELLPDEVAAMDRHRRAGLDILRGCCKSTTVLDIVSQAPAWFDGSRRNYPQSGENLPLGARILAIVDAFDSMTTDQVYRRALSRERAMHELYSCAGTQFDPDLVKIFSLLHDTPELQERVARRWLSALDPRMSQRLWKWNRNLALPVEDTGIVPLFQHKLLDNMHDAVVFVDRTLRITMWNRGAERLTGIAGNSVDDRTWLPSLVHLRDDRGELLDADCPVAYAIQSGVQSLRRFSLSGRNGKQVQVDLHAVPVVDKDGVTHGATVVLHDASPEASLEKRCQSLHERATKDPLTQVANRAEFDRTHEMFVAAHLERSLPCSLIICDIDHFKKINDTFGHPAGDEALKSFSQLLKGFCRPGDLVARYGGEEFVMLCADCNNAAAADRAEEIRRAISELPQPVLNGQAITASFGVTEVQNGDTPATMLRRADRALLEAKQRGRNLVVQLGSGIGEADVEPKAKRWWFQRRGGHPDILVEKWLATPVPMQVAIEKLRGFVVDHFAEITSIDGTVIHLKIEGQRLPLLRRAGDRTVPFLVEFRFSEDNQDVSAPDGTTRGRKMGTHVYVAIRPKRDRDRRRNDAQERARLVMASVKAYLMATEEPLPPDVKTTQRNNTLVPWLRKKS